MYSDEPTIQLKLARRIKDLTQGYQKLDLQSRHPDDIWAVKLYKRLLERDRRLYKALFGAEA